MNPLRFFFILGVALSVTRGNLHAQSGDADSQLWSETRLIYKLNDKFDLFTAGSFRLTDDFTDFHRVSARVGFSWAPIPPLVIAPSYFYTVASPWTSFPKPENRICLLTTYRFDIGKGFLTLGNTTEYRMPEYGQDAFWLRPRIRLQYPVGPDKWRLAAFVANEIFYNNGREVFTQDQAFAGFQEKFTDSFTTDLYYCRRTAMNATFPNANAICIDFKITFGKTKGGPYEPQFR